jgi:hypothetical protein
MRIVLRASVVTLPTEKVWLHEEYPKDWKLHYSYLQHISTVTDITFLLPRFVLPQIYYFFSLSCYKHFFPGTSPLEPTVVPSLRLQVTHCSTYLIVCGVPSKADLVVNILNIFLVYYY